MAAMAKHKGKSKRRIKSLDEHAIRDREAEAALSPQSLAERGVKIPAHRLNAPEENLEDLPKAEGMIVGLYPGGAMVRCDDRQLLAAIAKTFRPPPGATPLAVGDDVTVALTQGQHTDGSRADKDRSDGMIIARQPRRTLLARPQPTSAKRRHEYNAESFQKVIVANMDVLLIVVSLRKPKLRPGLIDRFLIVAERGELQPTIAINKIDLARPDDAMLAELGERGLDVVQCSALTCEGVPELAGRLVDRRSILAGASGVGKSALINTMIPGANALTRKIRSKDNRGRHTTSAAVVYDLPAGGMIVDTPGIRELGMDLTADQLPWYFPEFEPYVGKCRFNNCTHTHEPDCAILAAVDAGAIPPRRYGSYRRILETL